MADQLVVFDTTLLDKVWRGTTTPTVSSFTVTVEGTHSILKSTGAFADNTLYLLNDSVTGASRGYAAVVLVKPGDGIGGEMYAVGFGPNVAGEYGNRCFIASNPDGGSPTDSPADIGIWQEQDNGSGYFQHRRIFLDGTNKAITIYGWSNSAAAGTAGVYVDSAAAVGIGTSTLATNAAMTVNGHVKSLQRTFSVHKNGTDQTISASTWTKLTWSTEKIDQGSCFASNAWTPNVAGIVALSGFAYCTSTTVGERILLAIRKNGSATEIAVAELIAAANTAQETIVIPTIYDSANGSTDFYELWVFRSVGTVISGGVMYTQFNGTLQ